MLELFGDIATHAINHWGEENADVEILVTGGIRSQFEYSVRWYNGETLAKNLQKILNEIFSLYNLNRGIKIKSENAKCYVYAYKQKGLIHLTLVVS